MTRLEAVVNLLCASVASGNQSLAGLLRGPEGQTEFDLAFELAEKIHAENERRAAIELEARLKARAEEMKRLGR